MAKVAMRSSRRVTQGRAARVVRSGGRRAPASADAYRQLRDAIIAGRLRPGEPLVETELCARLRVSRTPVRAALQRLQGDGLVVGASVGNVVRALVAPLTLEDMGELFAIAGVLDGIAARWAAELDGVKRRRLVDDLERLNREMSAAARARPLQVPHAQDLHERFHEALAAAAAGPRLRAELLSLKPQVERYSRAYTGLSLRDFHESLEEHDAMIAAIGNGDADAAEGAATRNWRNGAERYHRAVEAGGGPNEA